MMPFGQALSIAGAIISYMVAGWLIVSHIARDVRASRKARHK